MNPEVPDLLKPALRCRLASARRWPTRSKCLVMKSWPHRCYLPIARRMAIVYNPTKLTVKLRKVIIETLKGLGGIVAGCPILTSCLSTLGWDSTDA